MTKLNEFTQTLRDRIPLSLVIARFVAIKKKGREFVGLCPFHQEKGASFTINDEKGFYHCFGCGAHGDHFNFVMQKLNIPFIESVEYLAEQAHLSVPKFENTVQTKEVAEINDTFYGIMEKACQWFEGKLRTPEAEPIRNYLIQRGLTGVIAKKFRLGYAPESGLKEFFVKQGIPEKQMIQLGLLVNPEGSTRTYDRFRGRVIFPIQDIKGRVIAFGGRILENGEPKYLNSPDTPLFHKGRQLYSLNHSLVKARQGQPFIVVEGYMDAISLHQAGIETAVAPLGTAITIEQLTLLWKTCPLPILCFDGDEAGKRAAERAAKRALEIIKPGYSLSFCFLEFGEDPDTYIKKYGAGAFSQLIAKAKPLIDVLWDDFITHQELTTPEQKAKARKDILELTKQIRDPDTQHFYRQDFNERLKKRIQDNFVEKKVYGRQKFLLSDNGAKKLSVDKKIVDGYKILLATLINHPTLIMRVTEYLMDLALLDNSLDQLRQKLLDICQETPHIEAVSLKEKLQQTEFKTVLEQLLCREIYEKARFTHPTASEEQALEGWLEVWKMMQEVQNLQQEVTQTAAELSSSLDEQVWQKLKLLKKTLVVQKTT